MIQIVTQNSVLSQNWVECTGCTPKSLWLCARCARTAPRLRAQRRVVAHWAPCLGHVVGRVASRVARSRCHVAALLPSPWSQYKKLYRDSIPVVRTASRVTRAQRHVVALYRSLATSYRDTKGRPPVTIQKLYHEP